MAELLDLPQSQAVYISAFAVPPGRKRRRWTVQRVETDGAIEDQGFVGKTRDEAEWLAQILRKQEWENREIDRMILANPLFRMLATLDPNTRRAAIYVLHRVEAANG